MAETCSNPSCSKPGTLVCSRCKRVRYCGPACQRRQWATHKPTCTAATATPAPPGAPKKANCYILHAAAAADAPALDHVSRHLSPFHLTGYGSEGAEMRQLATQLGWQRPVEVGKFYNDRGADGWYYYAYGDERAFDAAEAGEGLPM